jgi:hypothetical protein
MIGAGGDTIREDFVEGGLMRGFLSRVNGPAMLLAVAIGLGALGREARAQGPAGSAYATTYRVSSYFIAPGWYGTSYGFGSYGMPQTYSVYSAYPGPSYGSNFPPYGLLPGRFGVGLWRPGYVAPGYVYGASYYPSAGFAYRTWPFPYGAPGASLTSPPPIGVYAPALGPGW